MRRMAFLLLGLMLLAVPLACMADVPVSETPPVQYSDAQPLRKPALDASASISTAEKIKHGAWAKVKITFRNDGSEETFYNVHFNDRLPQPAGLILFDDSKKYIADLFTGNELGMKVPQDQDWSIVKAKEVVEAEQEFWMPNVKPGRYHLQLVYWLRFTAPAPLPWVTPKRPLVTKEDEEAFWREFNEINGKNEPHLVSGYWERPLFRSNSVVIDVE